jgi:DNA replication protein DnaC
MSAGDRTRLEMETELKASGRALMLSNRTTEAFAARATPKQLDFLLEMMRFELDYREENRRRRVYRKAALPSVKTFDSYEWGGVRLPPQLSREELTGCGFIERSMNLVLYGPVGTGKTHMAVALGAAACEMGIGVRFFTVSELVLRLMTASAEGRLDRVLGDIMKSDLVILDEFGYVPIDRDGARLLFQVVSECYEARSLVITTNVEFSRWGSILTDDQMAAAMIDRIAHHGHLIVFEGESYRMRNALMRQQ